MKSYVSKISSDNKLKFFDISWLNVEMNKDE